MVAPAVGYRLIGTLYTAHKVERGGFMTIKGIVLQLMWHRLLYGWLEKVELSMGGTYDVRMGTGSSIWGKG